MNGATPYETAEVLGHNSVETTKRYAHLSVEHKQPLTDRLMEGIARKGFEGNWVEGPAKGIPVFLGAEYLSKSLRSMINQSYMFIEVENTLRDFFIYIPTPSNQWLWIV